MSGYESPMSSPWTTVRLRAELGALEASANRARAALACNFSSSEEFEAAVLAARRNRRLMSPARIREMRFVLAATAGAAVLAIVAMAF
jgi:hypothetical protein